MNPFWLLDTCSFAVGIGCNRGILALDTMAFEPASRVEPARVLQSGTRALVLEHITNRCAPHDCIVILDMAKSFCARVRADLVHLGFKAEVAQFASQALAADLRSQLVNLVDKALWWSAGKKRVVLVDMVLLWYCEGVRGGRERRRRRRRVKKVAFPLQPGSVSIPVDVSTSALIPASLAKVDVHITAEDQKGESVVCLDVHTAQQSFIV